MRFLNPKKRNTVKGIMFKEPLYNAIVRGNKTQTRRVVKVKEKGLDDIILHGVSIHASLKGLNPSYWADISGRYDNSNSVRKPIRIKPRYNVGETVYLKEPYELIYKSWDSSGEPLELNFIEYKYDRENLDPEFIWKNKMFMPERYARRFIKITNIRVERLQDITRSDIRSEGLIVPEHLRSDDIEYNYRQWLPDEWKRLWDSINKPPYSWADNPFNWVYEFELTEKPE